MKMKKCNKCREIKDLSNFGKDKSRTDGLTAYCASCRRAISRIWKSKNRERIRENRKRMRLRYAMNLEMANCKYVKPLKVCHICKFEKLATEFRKDSYSRDGLSGVCRKCLCSRKRQAYHENEELRKRTLLECKRYRDAHKEQIRQRLEVVYRSDQYKERVRNYRERNIESCREKSRRRSKRHTEMLTPGHVRSLLAARGLLSARDIPDSLVQAKREHMLLVRELKQYKR